VSEIDFLVGRTVVEVRYDERVVFEAGSKPEPRLYADVGYAICLDERDRPVPVEDLVGRTVSDVDTDGGVLQIRFTDGTTLRTDHAPDVEAWQVVGGSPQALVVCLPGGELAVVKA
jgi:Family of unknown function (DUF6188)